MKILSIILLHLCLVHSIELVQKAIDEFLNSHGSLLKKLSDAPAQPNEACSICYDSMESDVTALHCNHRYHKGCLASWIKDKNSCPMCRAPVGHPLITFLTQNSNVEEAEANQESIQQDIIRQSYDSSVPFEQFAEQNLDCLNDFMVLVEMKQTYAKLFPPFEGLVKEFLTDEQMTGRINTTILQADQLMAQANQLVGSGQLAFDKCNDYERFLEEIGGDRPLLIPFGLFMNMLHFVFDIIQNQAPQDDA